MKPDALYCDFPCDYYRLKHTAAFYSMYILNDKSTELYDAVHHKRHECEIWGSHCDDM
jgi:hypothetical protein